MNRRVPRRALTGQLPVGHRGPIEIKRITHREVLDRHPVVVLADKRFAGNALLARQTLPDPGADSVDQLRLRVRRLHRHLDTTISAFLGTPSLPRPRPPEETAASSRPRPREVVARSPLAIGSQ